MFRRLGVIAVGLLLVAACGGGSSKPKASPSVTNAPGSPTTLASGTPTTSAVNMQFTTAGTIGGTAFNGNIAPGELQCTSTGNGQYTEVVWSGTVPTNGKAEQVSGDMNLKTGSQDLQNASMSLVLNGDFNNRLGSPTGTATIATDGKSGTIDAKMTYNKDNATLKGTFKCT
jgi:hypothetical protein